MLDDLPPHLRRRAAEVETFVRHAFKGVPRKCGVTWSESEIVDNYGAAEQRAQAAALDRESCWEDLVDDPAWTEDVGTVAPAMIRTLRRGSLGEHVYLTPALLPPCDDPGRHFTLDQIDAILSFLRLLLAMHQALLDTELVRDLEERGIVPGLAGADVSDFEYVISRWEHARSIAAQRDPSAGE